MLLLLLVLPSAVRQRHRRQHLLMKPAGLGQFHLRNSHDQAVKLGEHRVPSTIPMSMTFTYATNLLSLPKGHGTEQVRTVIPMQDYSIQHNHIAQEMANAVNVRDMIRKNNVSGKFLDDEACAQLVHHRIGV
jgi:hypothetical protein